MPLEIVDIGQQTRRCALAGAKPDGFLGFVDSHQIDLRTALVPKTWNSLGQGEVADPPATAFFVELAGQLFERAAFGKQVDAFMTSDVGKYVMNRAQQSRKDAFTDFAAVDATDVSAVQDIQNRLKVAESIVQWLRDAVMDGVKAFEILEDRSE